MFERIVSFFTKNKKSIMWVSSILMLFFLDFDITLAETEKPSAGEQAVEITNALMKVIAWIIWIMTAFVSLFLQPDWVNGSFIELDKYMKAIWILMTNVVYMIFAFILIFIAFANIIGKWTEKFELKQALPKFIVWVLMVPISWFVVQFLISLAWVLTVAALSLPYDTFKDRAAEFPVFSIIQEEWDEWKPLAEAKVCVKYMIHFWETPIETVWWTEDGESTVRTAEQNKKDPIYCKDDGYVSVTDILSWKKDEDGKESIYSIISLYTFWILGLESIDNVEAAHISDGGMTNIISFFTKNIVSLVFILIYFILLIALFYALFIRILRIWIFTMLSPLFGLLYFFWKTWLWEWKGAHFNLTQLFALIMTPVYVSLALSFGFMFMLVAWSGINKQAQAEPDDKVVPIRIGIIEIDIVGTVNKSWDDQIEWEENYVSTALRSFRGLGGAMWEIIVLLFWVGMFWLAVMAALKQSEITKAAIEPIESFGKQVGSLAASAPMYAPIIPTGKGWMQSISSVSEIAKKWVNYYSGAPGRKANEFIDKQWLFWATWTQQKINTAVWENQHRISDTWLDEATITALRNILWESDNLDDFLINTQFISVMQKALKGIKKDDLADKLRPGDQVAMRDAFKAIEDAADGKAELWGWLFKLDATKHWRELEDWADLKKVFKNKYEWKVDEKNNDHEIVKITNWVTFTSMNNLKVDGDISKNLNKDEWFKYLLAQFKDLEAHEIQYAPLKQHLENDIGLTSLLTDAILDQLKKEKKDSWADKSSTKKPTDDSDESE